MNVEWNEIADGKHNERQAVIHDVQWTLYSDHVGNEWTLGDEYGNTIDCEASTLTEAMEYATVFLSGGDCDNSSSTGTDKESERRY